jgi:transcriptional regulator GlxA family with amidase domain
MLRQIFATVRRLDRRDSHPDRDPFWDEIESNLLSALLLVCMQEQPKSAEFAASAGMRRAMDYVHANARQSLTLADLVAASGIPGRTLFRHFRAATGAGPVGYLRRVRLAAVRDELLAGAGESVAAVAQRWGFHDLGRFAGVYRSQYGENPSSTLRLAR